MPLPEIGQVAPDFELPRAGGGSLGLASLRGRPVVLYFYPRDDTPSCTLEARDFSALAADFAAAGAMVVGISPDSAKSHDKFKAKHSLAVDLVADEARSTIEAYGLWVEKSMFALKYMGVRRATVLIDADGKVARVWPNVRVAGHAAEVLAAVEELQRRAG